MIDEFVAENWQKTPGALGHFRYSTAFLLFVHFLFHMAKWSALHIQDGGYSNFDLLVDHPLEFITTSMKYGISIWPVVELFDKYFDKCYILVVQISVL